MKKATRMYQNGDGKMVHSFLDTDLGQDMQEMAMEKGNFLTIENHRITEHKMEDYEINLDKF